MTQIQTMTADYLQDQTFFLPDGSSVSIEFYYRPTQYGWFINSLTYGSFVLNGLRISDSPNLLRQFKNQLPFGLACVTNALRDPTQLEDFASGASNLYFLDASEVQDYEDFLSNG